MTHPAREKAKLLSRVHRVLLKRDMFRLGISAFTRGKILSCWLVGPRERVGSGSTRGNCDAITRRAAIVWLLRAPGRDRADPSSRA
jgi:hypothetical protein